MNEIQYVSNKQPFTPTVQSLHKALKNTKSGTFSTSYKVKAACMDFLGSIGLVPSKPNSSE